MRTWDENRTAINQLWPQCQWTDEERRLWNDDLSGEQIDQEVLYDALRNVKRSHDTLYPQLKWIRDEYNSLRLARKSAQRQAIKREPKLDLSGISDEQDKRLSEDFVALIDISSPADFDDIEARVIAKVPEMHARSAIRVLNYARKRLLGETQQFGKLDGSGEVKTLTAGAKL